VNSNLIVANISKPYVYKYKRIVENVIAYVFVINRTIIIINESRHLIYYKFKFFQIFYSNFKTIYALIYKYIKNKRETGLVMHLCIITYTYDFEQKF